MIVGSPSGDSLPRTPQRCSSTLRRSAGFVCNLVVAWFACAGCTSTETQSHGETIRIGASLPFTGNESAMGRNLEQAMLLAVDDINATGGINGVPIELITRDSNSGSARGLNDILDLLYNEQVDYLIGPEETELAKRIVEDVRRLDVLNILPGDAAPASNSSSTMGSWLRLSPTPFSIACGLGAHAISEGAQTANAIYSLEDYNTSLATDFRFHYKSFGGRLLSSVTIQSAQDSYQSAIGRVVASNADETLLIAYPAAAAELITEWKIAGGRGKWYLSPLLRTEVFLLNIPYGALDGSFGLSPALSLRSECQQLDGYAAGPIECSRANRRRFVNHFVQHSDGTRPFTAAHFYYDSVVLLASALQFAVATQGSIPGSKELHRIIRNLNQTTNEPGYWYDLPSAMKSLAAGHPVRYVGAAAEYEFNEFGVAQHRTFDSWTIRNNAFLEQGAYYASCPDLGAM
ncbi:MAG: ABC transporter substrate-binding protein [Myxococcales bacterium]